MRRSGQAIRRATLGKGRGNITLGYMVRHALLSALLLSFSGEGFLLIPITVATPPQLRCGALLTGAPPTPCAPAT